MSVYDAIAKDLEEKKLAYDQQFKLPVLDPNTGAFTGEFYDSREAPPEGQPDPQRLQRHIEYMRQKWGDKFRIHTGQVLPDFQVADPYESSGLFDSIGNIISEGYKSSLTGMAQEALTGEDPSTYMGLIDLKDTRGWQPNTLEKIATSIFSFVAGPVDWAAMYGGGKIGTSIGQLVAKKVITKAATRAIGAKIAQGMSREAAKKGVARTLTSIAAKIGESAGSLGAYQGTGEALRQFNDNELDVLKIIDETARGAALGGIMGGAGAKLEGAGLGRLGREAGNIGVGVGGLGVAAPILEGRTPTEDDIIGALGLTVGMRGIGAISPKKILSKINKKRGTKLLEKEITGKVEEKVAEAKSEKIDKSKYIRKAKSSPGVFTYKEIDGSIRDKMEHFRRAVAIADKDGGSLYLGKKKTKFVELLIDRGLVSEKSFKKGGYKALSTTKSDLGKNIDALRKAYHKEIIPLEVYESGVRILKSNPELNSVVALKISKATKEVVDKATGEVLGIAKGEATKKITKGVEKTMVTIYSEHADATTLPHELSHAYWNAVIEKNPKLKSTFIKWRDSLPKSKRGDSPRELFAELNTANMFSERMRKEAHVLKGAFPQLKGHLNAVRDIVIDIIKKVKQLRGKLPKDIQKLFADAQLIKDMQIKKAKKAVAKVKKEKVGYSTHGYWADSKEIYEIEKERGNTVDKALLKDGYKAIWVTEKPEDAVRYNRDADEFLSDRPPTKDELSEIIKVDLTGARRIKSMDDGDGGSLWIVKTKDVSTGKKKVTSTKKTKTPKAKSVALNKDEVVHWTDKDGLTGIFDNGEIAPGSMTNSIDLPFDVDNNLEFGIIFKDKDVKSAGGKKLDANSKGVTPLELKHEIRTEKAIPVTSVEAFVVRSDAAKKKLQKFLDNNGIGKTEIRIAKKPKYKTLDRPVPEVDDVSKQLPKMTVKKFTGKSSPLKTKKFAILTADNPENKRVSEKENAIATKKLEAELNKRGIKYTKAQGHYKDKPTDPNENSFILWDIDSKKALELGKLFKQESVLLPEGLVYSDGRIERADLDNIDFSGKQDNYYTKVIVDGKEVKFTIPIDDSAGHYKLSHYSSKGDLKVIDPKYMGTSIHAGEEIKNQMTADKKEMLPGFLRKSNFYIEYSGSSKEPHRFGKLNEYQAYIEADKLYKVKPGDTEQPSDTELKKRGFDGYINIERGQARLFKPIEVRWTKKSAGYTSKSKKKNAQSKESKSTKKKTTKSKGSVKKYVKDQKVYSVKSGTEFTVIKRVDENTIRVKLGNGSSFEISEDMISPKKPGADYQIKKYSKETAKKEAKKHGLIFNGFQEMPNNKPPLGLFTDKETGSTFAVPDIADIAKLAEKKRREFSDFQVLKKIQSAAKSTKDFVEENNGFIGAVKKVHKKIASLGKMTELGETVKRAVAKRDARLQQQAFDYMYAMGEWKKKLSKSDQSDIKFAMQKTGNPKHPGETYSDLMERLSPEAKRAIPIIEKRFSDIQKKFHEAGYKRASIENYITQMWSGTNKQKAAYARFLMKDPFSRKRVIESYRDGIIKFGLRPRFDSALDVLAVYERMNVQVIENRALINHIKLLRSEDGNKLIYLAGRKNIPDGYVAINSSALALATAGYKRGGVNTVYVHPEVVKPLKVVFSEPFSGKFARSVEMVNAVSKKLKLSFSLFHHLALTESAIYSGIYNPYKAMKEGLKFIENKELRDAMIEAGLILGTPNDVQRNLIQRGLESISASQNKMLSGLGRGASTINDWWDTALWDKYHRGLKAYAFQSHWVKELKKNPNMSDATARKIKEGIATHVNDAFGGQNWNALLKDKRTIQVMHWLLLAPDWTWSNARIAMSAFKSKAGGTGAAIQGKLARRYWVRAAAAFFIGSNLLNKALSGHWMFENEPDHRLDVDTGAVDDSGRRIFVKASKQIREPLRWATAPLYEAKVKVSPIIQMLFEQATGKTITGWPTDIASEKGDFWKSIPSRAKELVKHLKPFSFSGSNRLFMLPESKGMSAKVVKVDSRGRKYIKSGYHRTLWKNRILDLIIAGKVDDAKKMMKEWNKYFPGKDERIAAADVSNRMVVRRMLLLSKKDFEK